jgi:hypothetical protein
MVHRYYLILVVLLCSWPVASQPTNPCLYYDQALQVSHNPLGLQAASKVFYRFPLFEPEGVLWETTKFDLGVQNNLSPSYEMIGAFANFEPIAFFSLAASAQIGAYYNTFGYGFYELTSYDSSIDPTEMINPTRNAFGAILNISPTLKCAYDMFVATNTFGVTYYYADNGQGFFFERINNTPLKKSDIELTNSANLLINPIEGLYAGVNDSLLFVPGSGYVSHRLCGVVAYTLPINQGFSFYSGLFLGTFLSDRYFQYSFYTGAGLGMTLKLD